MNVIHCQFCCCAISIDRKPEAIEQNDKMDKIMLDYAELVKSGSDPKSFFKLFRKPVFVEHKAKHAQWFGCVLWDDVARKEFQIHEETKSILQTKMFLGRMLRNCIKDPLEGMAEQMRWKQHFLLVDVIGDKFETCGINKYLRVRETPTWNTGGGGSDGFHELKTWDLVIFPECLELAEEMIRPEYCGVKKTLCIWNADVFPYPEPWIDCGGHISGEIFLKPTMKLDEKILTVIIFHHGGLGNLEGVPVQNLKFGEEDKVVKFLSENFHHCEWMIAKLYPGSAPMSHSITEETVEESDISVSAISEQSDNDTEKRNGVELASIPVLRDIVEQLPVDNLGPLKEKLEKLRGERMPTKLGKNEEIRSGPFPATSLKVSEKDMYLGSSSASVVTSDDEYNIAGSCDHGQEADMIIYETDYENSDAGSGTMSIDVMKETNKEFRELAKYFLGFRK